MFVFYPGLPHLSTGVMYTHLAEGVGHSGERGAFRALKWGFSYWSSGKLVHLDVNVRHPLFCHVRDAK